MGMEIDSPIHNVWKCDLYRMQLSAPVPIPILCDHVPMNRPNYLGADYHGSVSHVHAENRLKDENDGAYLVRDSKCSNGTFHTLSLRFNGNVHHYKLYYDGNKNGAGLYIREKRYDCVRSLVADGLVTMYLEQHAPVILQRLPTANYQESPYMTLNKRKLRALSREHSRSRRFSSNFQNSVVASNATGTPITINNNPTLPTLASTPLTPPSASSSASQAASSKSHVFKVTTFKGLNWCEFCGNFLWGFTAQGVKCEDCGLITHSRCSERIPNDCVPDLKYVRGVFGIELTTLLAAHHSELPFVVTKCVAEVEARGLTAEGIYRLSGYAEEIEAIKMAFDTDGDKADLSQEKYPNVNVITGALKLYLRLLPVPLITFLVHPFMIKAMEQKNVDLRESQLKQAMQQLPKAHHDTLKYMMEHLNRVSQHHAINKMTAHNLATVFAPTLIGPSTDPVALGPPDMTSDIYLLETLIQNCDRLFS